MVPQSFGKDKSSTSEDSLPVSTPAETQYKKEGFVNPLDELDNIIIDDLQESTVETKSNDELEHKDDLLEIINNIDDNPIPDDFNELVDYVDTEVNKMLNFEIQHNDTPDDIINDTLNNPNNSINKILRENEESKDIDDDTGELSNQQPDSDPEVSQDKYSEYEGISQLFEQQPEANLQNTDENLSQTFDTVVYNTVVPNKDSIEDLEFKPILPTNDFTLEEEVADNFYSWDIDNDFKTLDMNNFVLPKEENIIDATNLDNLSVDDLNIEEIEPTAINLENDSLKFEPITGSPQPDMVDLLNPKESPAQAPGKDNEEDITKLAIFVYDKKNQKYNLEILTEKQFLSNNIPDGIYYGIPSKYSKEFAELLKTNPSEDQIKHWADNFEKTQPDGTKVKDPIPVFKFNNKLALLEYHKKHTLQPENLLNNEAQKQADKFRQKPLEQNKAKVVGIDNTGG